MICLFSHYIIVFNKYTQHIYNKYIQIYKYIQQYNIGIIRYNLPWMHSWPYIMNRFHKVLFHGSLFHGSLFHGSLFHGSLFHGSMFHGSLFHGSLIHRYSSNSGGSSLKYLLVWLPYRHV